VTLEASNPGTVVGQIAGLSAASNNNGRDFAAVFLKNSSSHFFPMLYRTYQPGTIKVEPPRVTSESTDVVARLERIAEHYRQLDELLTSIEAQLPLNSGANSVVASPSPPTMTAENSTSKTSPEVRPTPSQELRRRKPR
jgi:type II secretory pathway component GspD/PulD (secretin)